MSDSKIDEILEARKRKEGGAKEEGDQFFSVLSGDGLEENFLEIRFRNGLRTCFAYSDLMWFNYDPDVPCIDLEFSGFLVSVQGRGLDGKMFSGIKGKRIAWIKESDSDMQDHEGNETYIEQITIQPPEGFGEEEDEGGEDR